MFLVILKKELIFRTYLSHLTTTGESKRISAPN